MIFMKKIITTLFICAAIALSATAGDFTTNVTQTTNLAKEFSMSKSSEGSNPMNIYSQMTIPILGDRSFKFEYYFVQCIVTPGDMEDVPIGAKVTSIACGGEKITSQTGAESADTLYLATYIKNDVDPETDDYKDVGQPEAKAGYSDDELYGPMTKIGLSSPEGEEVEVIHSDFDIAKPFQYTGNIFKVGLDIYAPDSIYFRYNTTYAETEVATTYHLPDYHSYSDLRFYYGCDLVVLAEMMGIDMGMTFEPNKLPAFTLSYYTNDVKGVVTGAGGELALSDGENTLTKTVAAGEEFAFENVDYTKTYTLNLNGEVVAEDLAFDDITKDLYVEIASSGTTPVAGDVNGDGDVTAADVTALYNFILNNDTSNLVNGDQNGDGDITSSDVTVVYNILLGTE